MPAIPYQLRKLYTQLYTQQPEQPEITHLKLFSNLHEGHAMTKYLNFWSVNQSSIVIAVHNDLDLESLSFLHIKQAK